LPHEYLNFWLTGRICAEFGDASGTGFFDVRKREWAREVLDEIDGGTGQLYAALPELISVEELVGQVKPEVAAELGISGACIVSAGGGDNMMGAIGTGNVREGVVTLSLGTSSTVYSFSEAPVLDETGNVAPFCSSSDGWLPLVCTMNATNVVTQTLMLLGKNVMDIESALMETQPGSDGICFVPFLNGERTPDLPTARGSIVGLAANNFTASNLIRAVIEGVSFGILNGLDLVLGGKPVESILVIGGGARSAQWRQLIADTTGASIEVPSEPEAGCLGAAMQAMFVQYRIEGRAQSFGEIAARCVNVEAAGGATPRPEKMAAYRAARETYQQHLASLYSVQR
jgi:xylulokinase